MANAGEALGARGPESGSVLRLWTELSGLFVQAADRSVWLRLSAAMAAAVAAAALAVAGPIALKYLLDALTGQAASAVSALVLVGLYVGALGGARLAEQAQAYCFGTGEQRLQQRLNALMFSHVLALPMGFHLDRQAGGLAQTLTLGLQGARIIMTHALFAVLPVAVQAVLIAAVVIEVFDLAVWLVVMGAILAYALVFAWGVKRLTGATRAVSAAQVEAGGQFTDGLINVEPVKAFGAEAVIGRRYQDLLGEAEQRWRVFYARRSENGVLAGLVFSLALGAVLAIGVQSFARGTITLGDFVLLNAYMLQLVRPIELMGFALRDIAQAGVYLERWAEFLRLVPETEIDVRPALPPSAAGVMTKSAAGAARGGAARTATASALGVGPAPGIEPAHAPHVCFDEVCFGYADQRPILSSVSFSVAGGTTAAIVGPSGAGKSSLVRLMLRYYAPEVGCIRFDGVDICAMPIEAVRAMIAVVSQDTVLFNASLGRNIAFARPDANIEEIDDAVRRARLSATVARLPNGLDTLVGERGLKLSGGERQRVAIARAALKQAPILVFDEATSALDAATEREVCADMLEAAGGRTALIVTHRLQVAARADSVIVLDAGHVAEQGSHEALLAQGGAYAGLWRRQHGKGALSGTI